jgi:hypothetical protein
MVTIQEFSFILWKPKVCYHVHKCEVKYLTSTYFVKRTVLKFWGGAQISRPPPKRIMHALVAASAKWATFSAPYKKDFKDG